MQANNNNSNNKSKAYLAKITLIGTIITVVGSIITTLIIQYHSTSDTANKIRVIPIEVSGTVVDENSNQSIRAASIDVVGRSEQYLTEQNGNFHILIKDSITSIRLRVSKKGFQTFDRSYNIPTEGIIIQLSPK